jgi:hypothetical protein
MSQETALHGLRISRRHDLVPHEANAINLVRLYTTGNVLVHHNKSLILGSCIVDDDPISILIACMPRLG